LGGGFKFSDALCSHFSAFYVLSDGKNNHAPYDILFMMDPRKSKDRPYGLQEILDERNSVSCKDHDTKLIYRVNECDAKREESIGIEKITRKAIWKADMVVYVSKWLRDYYHRKYPELASKNNCVIFNGVDRSVFVPLRLQRGKHNGTPILITHHWSNNGFKGYDFYNTLNDHNGEGYRFIFIGRPHPKQRINKIEHHSPQTNPSKLAELLAKADIYVTASQCEPSGNHFMEGLSVGLPVLYRHSKKFTSGGIDEIACLMGERFGDFELFKISLEKVWSNYSQYQDKIKQHSDLLDVRISLKSYERLFMTIVNTQKK